jgi:UDP-N-acetylmuramate dehydrogenase
MEFRRAFESLQSRFTGVLEFDAPLSRVAYYRIGGPASVLATPRSWEDLQLLHGAVVSTGCPVFILGWGSNLLFSDLGFPGLVLRMKHLYSGMEEIGPGQLRVGASLGASSLLRAAAERGYGGLECLTGIPGSVGGMVTMNAGTHLGEIGTRVERTETILFGTASSPLDIRTRIHPVGDFSYRRNHFLQPGELVLHTVLRYEPADPLRVKKTIEELYQRRKSTQPVDLPSCGSVFMNPREAGLHAWQVVERLGLKGHRIGNAQISEKHGNFIVNLGGARASDVRELIQLVKSRALSELGIDLHEEVRILE